MSHFSKPDMVPGTEQVFSTMYGRTECIDSGKWELKMCWEYTLSTVVVAMVSRTGGEGLF